jgi:hypothetical protein
MEKLLKITADLGVKKEGQAPAKAGGFPFHRIDDVEAGLKPLLVEHGVMCYTSVTEATNDKMEVIKKGQNGGTYTQIQWHSEVEVEVTFVDVESPEEKLTLKTRGSGIDFSDKAIGKALSYACKNLYLSMFHLKGQPDNEDDADKGQVAAQPRQQQQQRRQQPAKTEAPVQSGPHNPDEPFGWGQKYKDTPIKDIPLSYFDWIKKNTQASPALTAKIMAEVARRANLPKEGEVPSVDVNADVTEPPDHPVHELDAEVKKDEEAMELDGGPDDLPY